MPQSPEATCSERNSLHHIAAGRSQKVRWPQKNSPTNFDGEHQHKRHTVGAYGWGTVLKLIDCSSLQSVVLKYDGN